MTTESFKLTTNAFPPQGNIPKDYTCSGSDTSPTLSWTGYPPGTRTFALTVEDPNAAHGTFTH
jgi:phosphatidylethanolamine-binding protein (PEBP) family uncharacterized protein